MTEVRLTLNLSVINEILRLPRGRTMLKRHTDHLITLSFLQLQLIHRAAHPPHLHIAHMRVELRRAHIFMPHQFLDVTDIHSIF